MCRDRAIPDNAEDSQKGRVHRLHGTPATRFSSSFSAHVTRALIHRIPGDRLPVGLRKGLFKLPEDITTPIVCVGPGTGVAPMRAIIEDRTSEGAASEWSTMTDSHTAGTSRF